MSNLSAHSFVTFDTVNGRCSIAWSDVGIAGVLLPTDQEGDIRRWHARRVPSAVLRAPGPRVLGVIEAVVRYFNGERIDFRGIPVDMRAQNEFFVRIYEALRQIPYGQVTTVIVPCSQCPAVRPPSTYEISPVTKSESSR